MIRFQEGRFLTVGLSGLVLMDLVDLISSTFPALSPLSVTSVGEALDRLKEAERIPLAVINLGPEDFDASELAPLLKEQGTQVVLFGEAAEEAMPTCPYPVLLRPFGSDDVLRILSVEA